MRKGKIGIILIALAGSVISARADSGFRFERDSFSFANMTVFEYQNGVPHLRRGEAAKQERYTRRCFVMSRAIVQFRKFARFDPHAPPVDDTELAARVRQVTHRAVWKPELPQDQRVVFPYADLRQMSEARGRLLQETIGHGWPTYWRPGNYRMIFEQGRGYQEATHKNLNDALGRGELFIGYLTTLPFHMTINHAVLVYEKERSSSPGMDRYLVYDANHPEGPRVLTWSESDHSFVYEKDWDYVGGKVRVYQVYGKPFQ